VGARPVFHYDLSSPFSYLAAMRVDDVMPVKPTWEPVVFGAIIQRRGKVPWSFEADRSKEFDELARRAAQRGLPELRYPPGWPRESYSVLPLRAALVAGREGRIEDFSRAGYEVAFSEGQPLNVLENVLDAAQRAGLDPAVIEAGVQEEGVKARLRELTERALERGVTGVPTVVVGDHLFWGDDRLEDAARAAAE
jgi:2-hydroxychromene-2-carboxylate isomerase